MKPETRMQHTPVVQTSKFDQTGTKKQLAPLPWKCTGQETSKYQETIRDANGLWIADCVVGSGTMLANAVNSYTELLEALQDIVNDPYTTCPCADKASQAISRATGNQ